MAIKPILFNTEMVKAILDGRKTCTRRVIKLPENMDGIPVGKSGDSSNPLGFMYPGCIKRPQYLPGDILYVRETWMDYAGRTMYRADCDKYRLESLKLAEFSWEPSIHMPKEAARIWLRVTDVRMERLQDITEDGAKAEGMPDIFDYPVDKAYCPLCKGEGIIGTVNVHSLGHMDVDCSYCDSYRKRFENLWNSINQKCLDYYGWDANPWVWVIEFERCEKPVDA